MNLIEYYHLPEGTKINSYYYYNQDFYLTNEGYPCNDEMDYYYNYKTNIQLSPHMNLSGTRMISNMFANSSINEDDLMAMANWDMSNIYDMEGLFKWCSFTYMYPIENWNISTKLNEMGDLFYYCSNLKEVDISKWDTSNVYGMGGIFKNCTSLEKVGAIRADRVGDFSSYNGLFYSTTMEKLTDFGGLINLKCSLTGYGFDKCPNLNYQSCINILNGLYDFTGNGKTPASSQGKLKVHPNFLTLVGDEISIGTNKGWTITT